MTNSSLKTAGSGSPLIYSTGDIEVDAVKGTATGSQIAGIEGQNRILVYNSKLNSTKVLSREAFYKKYNTKTAFGTNKLS